MKHTIRVSSSSHTDAITKLLEIMDVEDVQGTGVQLITADERNRSREVTQAEEALRSHHDRAFLEDCMVHCLKVYNIWLSVSTPRLIFYWREGGRMNFLSLSLSKHPFVHHLLHVYIVNKRRYCGTPCSLGLSEEGSLCASSGQVS